VVYCKDLAAQKKKLRQSYGGVLLQRALTRKPSDTCQMMQKVALT
jgi:hypothetical protein